MGSASDNIKKGLTKGLAPWTKRMIAEEKNPSTARFRESRLIQKRDMFLTEALEKLLPDSYMRVSDNGTLPAKARQLFYDIREQMAALTGKELEYTYFRGDMLKMYILNHPDLDWDIVFDDRGRLTEPHTRLIVPLGTIDVRNYADNLREPLFQEAGFAPAHISTYGPAGCFTHLMYAEKEGFDELWKRVRLAERFDIAIMSSKGMSVHAARQLAEALALEYNVPILPLHDLDRSGVIIDDTLEHDTKTYKFRHRPKVIDLGLTYDDFQELKKLGVKSEYAGTYLGAIGDERLEKAGLKLDAIKFLKDRRVELNALTSRQLVNFVEGKLKALKIGKVIPNAQTLGKAYTLFAQGKRLQEAFEELQRGLAAAPVTIPYDITAKVTAILKEKSHLPWHEAVRLVVEPEPASTGRKRVRRS
jgi:hypothetical protein